jgi:hypothetical protein
MEQLLNSKTVIDSDQIKIFETIANQLIQELSLSDQFQLRTNISHHNSFKISISGINTASSGLRVYQINYDVGLFRMIFDTLYVVLSNNEFFKGIGYATKEFRIPTIEVPNWTMLDLAMANNEPSLFDSERAELHKFLYTLCLHIVVRHEIRHIANGHIGHLLGQNHRLFYEGSSNGLSPLDSQTLEMDVDSCVNAGLINGLLVLGQRNRLPKKLQTEEGIFYSALFALKILFYCLPSKKVSRLTEIQNSSHPNSCLRYFFSFTAGLSFLQDELPQFAELYGRTYQSSWHDFELLGMQGLLSFEKVMRDYEWSMSDEGMNYADSIWNNWNKWIPKLEPHAYLKLAPPEK